MKLIEEQRTVANENELRKLNNQIDSLKLEKSEVKNFFELLTIFFKLKTTYFIKFFLISLKGPH